MPDVPTSEPTTLRAGETWSWLRSLPDYPAPTWVLTYTLINSSAKQTITATASGADHLVSVAAATTGGYAAGTYTLLGRVAKSPEVYSVYSATLQVDPNLAAASTYETRTTAKKILDALDAYLLGRATANELETLEVTVGDRTLRSDRVSLLKLRETLKAEVLREQQADRMAAGLPDKRRLHVRWAS